jgi:hypothetical protein
VIRRALAVTWLAGACSKPSPPANADVTGTLVVDEAGSAGRGSAAEGQRGVVDEAGSAGRGSAAEGQRGVVDEAGSAGRGSAAEGQRGVVDGAPAQLLRCRPGHAVHVFVEVDTSKGTLHFGEGELAWNGSRVACSKLDRSWGGGVRRDGSAYFRGTLAFRCEHVAGELSLDCGGITPEEGAELANNRAAAGSAAQPGPRPSPSGTR